MDANGQTSPIVLYLREFAFICSWFAVFDTVREGSKLCQDGTGVPFYGRMGDLGQSSFKYRPLVLAR